MSKTVKLVLAISLVLNVLLGGMMIGKFMHHMGGDHGDRIAAVVENADLPEAKRAELLKRLDAVMEADQGREESRALREEALKMLVAEPFDRDRYRQAVSNMFAQQDMKRNGVADLLAEVAAELGPKDREKLADMFRHKRRH